jgi:hypothetical protein
VATVRNRKHGRRRRSVYCVRARACAWAWGRDREGARYSELAP